MICSALEELHLALDEQEVAGVERAEERLAGVPQAGADAAGAVAQFELEVQVAVAVGPQLLVRDQVDLLECSPSASCYTKRRLMYSSNSNAV